VFLCTWHDSSPAKFAVGLVHKLFESVVLHVIVIQRATFLYIFFFVILFFSHVAFFTLFIKSNIKS
jgi:hypothetical protein